MRRKQYKARFLAGILSFAVMVTSVPFTPLTVQAQAWDAAKAPELLELRFWEDEKPGVRFYINAAAKYILEDQKAQTEELEKILPAVGSTYGEWSVWDLLRGMYTELDYINEIPEGYFEDYFGRVEKYVEEKEGILDKNKSTEWSRLMLPLTAMGYDVTNVAGYDFIEKLSEKFSFSYRQGINGSIWEIISMNSGGYEFVENPEDENANTFGKMIDYIMNKEITDSEGVTGGWALDGNVPDPDVTGMALTALAPYYLDEASYLQTGAETSYEEMATAVERGILALDKMQHANGGFDSWGTINCESVVWAIVPLLELGIDPLAESISLPRLETTCSFVTEGAKHDGVFTNNMIDVLLSFWADGSSSTPSVGGFRHVTAGYDGGGGSGITVNAMATDQALYALIAYDRFLNKKTSLFNLSDQMNGSYASAKAKSYTIQYDGNGQALNLKQTASPYAEVVLPDDGKESSGDVSFMCWNTKTDGSGVTYYPGEVLCMPEQNVTLYAQYGRSSYNLKLELNGGTLAEGVVIPETFAPADEEILLPTEEQISKEGCKFGGWYIDASFTGSAVTSVPKGSYGDKVYYAKWTVSTEKANKFYVIVNRFSGHEVTLLDRADIQEARSLYDEMHPLERERITTSILNIFLEKEKQLKELEESLSRIERVNILISLINKEIFLSDEAAVKEAREAYEALSEEEKLQVVNLEILTEVEAALAVQKENQKKADAVAVQILSIKEVTLASEKQIMEVRKAYQALTSEQQALIPKNTQKVLTEAEDTLLELLEQKDRLMAFAAAVGRIPENPSLEDDSLHIVMEAYGMYLTLLEADKKQVTAADVAKITNAQKALYDLAQEVMTEENYEAVTRMEQRIASVSGKITLESEAVLKEIRIAFDAMTTVEQASVENYQVLAKLELDLEILKENTAVAEAMDKRFAAIGEITLESEELLAQLRKEYSALNTEQKNLLKNYRMLTEAERALADLKYNQTQAQTVISTIHAIGMVSLESRDAILEARAAYDQLIDKQKAYISDEILKILTDAESTYAAMEELVLRSISLDKESVVLKKEESVEIQVLYNPENTISDKTVTWSTADENVAVVENGKLLAKGVGETVITAHVGKLMAFCKVTVAETLESETESESETETKGQTESESEKKPDEPKQEIKVKVPGITLKSVKCSGSNKAVLKWKKAKGVSGYEIYSSVKNKKNWKRVKVIKKGNTMKWIRKKLKKGQKYFFRVRAYITMDGKNYYGNFSKVKSVRVKK